MGPCFWAAGIFPECPYDVLRGSIVLCPVTAVGYLVYSHLVGKPLPCYSARVQALPSAASAFPEYPSCLCLSTALGASCMGLLSPPTPAGLPGHAVTAVPGVWLLCLVHMALILEWYHPPDQGAFSCVH